MFLQLIKGNLWCSTNYDEQECYLKAESVAVDRVMHIVDIIQEARTVHTNVREHLEKTARKCHNLALKHLDEVGEYVEKHINACLT